uniref:Carboxypeptidase O n=1 Tax=Erpetoichthys calabaricus TaxID=27687 RepID=A0A8C4X6Q8_ERPCA
TAEDIQPVSWTLAILTATLPSFRTLIADVHSLLKMQVPGIHTLSLDSYNYSTYHPADQITNWMVEVALRHPDVVQLHLLGQTYEKKNILYLKIGNRSEQPKKIIWMDCGIHAREWISPAFCQWFVKEILQTYKSDAKVSRYLQDMDFYIVPVLNIDGYIYSWQTNRLWRKSRSIYPGNACFGTDLNRNFDSAWCSVGASRDPCSETYCGPRAESESEVKAVANLVRSRKADIVCFFTIHSYGQLILMPYGHPDKNASNFKELLDLGLRAAEAIKKKHGTTYRVGPPSSILYNNSGSSRDWARDMGIPFSYTLELRDNGTHGFLLPEEQIEATCQEAQAGVMLIVESVHAKYFSGATALASLWLTITASYVAGWALTRGNL